MGVHSAGGNIIYDTITADTVVTVDKISEKLCGTGKSQFHTPNAGWEHVQFLKAEFTFIAVFFSVGTEITIGYPGDDGASNQKSYIFTDGSIQGNVQLGSSLLETLGNWASIVLQDFSSWQYEILITVDRTAIRFFNILFQVKDSSTNPPTDEFIGNNLPLSVTPTGIIGFFDFNPGGITGFGRTFGAGHRIKTQKVSASAIPLIINIYTDGGLNGIAISAPDATATYDFKPGSWRILANKYQYFLMQLGGGATAGTFLFASHLSPSRGCVFANFMSGPQNGNYGSRGNFEGIGISYYVNVGLGQFAQLNTGDKNKNPTMCFPGFSYNDSNFMNAIPIQNDVGDMHVFDAFLAAPRFPLDDIYIIGWIWDALIYSNILAQDFLTSEINHKTAYTVLSQIGDRFSSQGSLVVQVTV